jgi:hypothetical protein
MVFSLLVETKRIEYIKYIQYSSTIFLFNNGKDFFWGHLKCSGKHPTEFI